MAEDENGPAEDELAVGESEHTRQDDTSEAEAPDADAPRAEATGAQAGETGPSHDELRAALDRVGVSDVLVEALMATVSLGFRRVSAEARDLPQAKLAVEALRALEPVLRDAGVDAALVRDLEQARTNLQLAYAKAVDEDLADQGA